MKKSDSIQGVANWAKIYYYPDYRTAIQGDQKYLHLIVTKVNYLTACLWLNYRNSKIKGRQKGFVELPNKPNWLVMVGNFRRMQDKKIRALEYLKERAKRKTTGLKSQLESE